MSRWPADAADGKSAIIMAVGGEPERFYQRLSVTWESWQGYFTPAVRQNTVLILLLDANFWTDLTKLIDHMDAKPLDCDKQECASSSTARRAFCSSLSDMVVLCTGPGRQSTQIT